MGGGDRDSVTLVFVSLCTAMHYTHIYIGVTHTYR